MKQMTRIKLRKLKIILKVYVAEQPWKQRVAADYITAYGREGLRMKII